MRRALCVLAAAAAASAMLATPAVSQAADLAATPYMGWNTYYGLGANYNEATIKAVAGTLISSGLAQAGYRIVWLDFGWSYGERDSSGQLTADPTRWPDGMAGLTAWLHQRGLEAGIYTDAGESGCDGLGVGSYGHYQQDADTFAAWGFDAVKVDFCGAGQEGFAPQPLYDEFANALRNNSSHRAMIMDVDNFLTAGQLDGTNPAFASSSYENYTWAPQVAQGWRTDTDIGFRGSIAFSNVVRNLDHDAAQPQAGGPGHWNDPDYLGPGLGMTSTEAQSQFSMWAMLAAPLILGSDPRVLSSQEISMLENANVIAIDQDPLGAQGTLLEQSGLGQVWAKPLANGDRAVALFNVGSGSTQITTTAAAVGLPPADGYTLQDLWSGATTTTDANGEITSLVPAHGVTLYRVSAGTGTSGAATTTPAPQVPLTIFTAGDGFGVVTDSGGEMSCPGLCAAAYDVGSRVTLTATPSGGSVFTGWSGGGCSGTATCTVTPSASTDVTATFEKLHTLTVSVFGGGTGTVAAQGISCPGNCSTRYPDGSSVTLTATPVAGSQFGAWLNGGCSRYDATCTFTSAGDRTLTIAFDRRRSGVAYVVNAGNDTVTPVALAGGQLKRAITGFYRPISIAIAPDGGTAYVVNVGNSTVTPIDLATNTKEAAIGGFKHPGPIAIAPDGQTAYVLEAYRRLVPIDLSTHRAEPVITFAKGSGVGEYPASIAIGRGGRFAYLGTFNRRRRAVSGTLTAIDLATGAVRAVVRGFARPSAIAITPDGEIAYVADAVGGSVTPVELATHRVIRAPALTAPGAFPAADAIAITPVRSAYVVDQTGVAVIDTATDTPDSGGLSGPSGAREVAITPDGGTVYVTAPGSGEVVPVDVATTTFRASVTGLSSPEAIAIADPPPPFDTAGLVSPPRGTGSGLSDRVRCASSTRSCAIAETLSIADVLSARDGKRPARRTLRVTVLGRRSVTVRPGRTTRVVVRLDPAGRALLEYYGRLSALLSLAIRRRGQMETLATRSVTIRA